MEHRRLEVIVGDDHFLRVVERESHVELLQVDTRNATPQSLGQLLVSALGVEMQESWQEQTLKRLERALQDHLGIKGLREL